MITEKDREILKPVLGDHYAPKTLKFMNDKKIAKPDGTPYTASTVRSVFNGYRKNFDIEMVFFEMRDAILQLKNDIEAKRAAISSV